MKKLFDFVKQPWFISLLGVLALSLLIWFLGPLFAFAGYEPLGPASSRLVVIASLFFFWLISRIWIYIKAKRRNNQIMSGLTASSEPALSPTELAAQDELSTLQERLQEALHTLKKIRLGGRSGRQFLYQLPWYILIGPPGSGKTTLLMNSDLKFPLAERFGKDAIRGVGGTRNCDWWFAEEAVLLDTAGRYTTQDSHEEADRAAWLGFLDLLKKHRRRRPINGALIAVSIADLLQQSEAELQLHANAIRKRIRELHNHFGIRFPVYLLFTKCDLLAGFMEYFDDLDHEERAQVWGMTFALDDDPKTTPIDQYDTEFNLLEQRLHSQMIEKLEGERNAERRNLIYTFPQQFSSLKQLTARFLSDIFHPTRYEHAAMLRGVYFTSATQEGSPIDRIMGAVAAGFGLDRQRLAHSASSGKSFFINRLLADVIFAEQGLAGANLKLERGRAWVQRGAFAGVLAVATLAGLAWATSYTRNKAYIEHVSVEADELQKMVDQLDPAQNNPLAVLPLLDKARHLPGGYTSREQGTPWSLDFGLYQGDKLGTAADSVYRKLLIDAFLPRLMTRQEQRMRENANNVEYLYETLKVYLMLADGKHYQRDAVRAWIALDWEHNLPLEVTNDQRKALLDHLDALLETRPAPLPRPLDTELIAWTRGMITRIPLADRVYGRLKLEGSSAAIPDFRISEAAGRDAPLVFTRKSGDPLNQGLPGLFTYAGYHDIFVNQSEQLSQQLAGESWVLGTDRGSKHSGADRSALREHVLERYLRDYIRQWDTLLNDIRIVPIANLAQATEVLKVLSGDQSPLRLLLEAVERETTLDRVDADDEKDKSWVDKAGETLGTARSTLGKIIGRRRAGASPAQPRTTVSAVSEHFKALNQQVRSENGTPAPIDNTLALLNELYIFLDAGGDNPDLEHRKRIASVISKIQREAKRNPYPINHLMTAVANDSDSLVRGGARQQMNSMWRSTVLPFCQQAIQGRYPINRGSSRDITQEDFTQFFGPGGLMDTFYNDFLAASVDKSGRIWRWNSRDGSPAGISPNALRQFQRADAIKSIFFRMGRQAPSFNFTIKPIAMSADIYQFDLNVDGQKLRYAHGPQRPTPIKWPGPDNTGQVSIQLSPQVSGSASGLTQEGPWALFRLFDLAQITPTPNPVMFILKFNIQGREATFQLRAGSAVNPFLSKDLHNFACPRNL